MLEKFLTDFNIVNVGFLIGYRDGLEFSFLVLTVNLVLLNSSVLLALELRLVIEVSLQVRGTLVAHWFVHNSLSAIRLSKRR